MNKLSNTQIKLLNALSDGLCHSGNDLGHALGISRTAIWKHIKHLSQLGLEVLSIHKQGYQLRAPIKLLDEFAVRKQLMDSGFNKPVTLHFFASVNSTNQYLKELPPSTTIDICCAEMQTQGRGRFGRNWYSPFGENIYCSSRWHFNSDVSSLSGLSLVISLAIVASLTDLSVGDDDIAIKWPNDILWKGKKLSGCLIEINAESYGTADVIIGIGINVNANAASIEFIDRPWCSLFEINPHQYDKNKLISQLIIQLNLHIQEFRQQGFAAFLSRWQALDYLQGQHICVSHPLGTQTGQAVGVNSQGQLLLLDDSGNIHHLSSGDTSLKALTG